MKIAKYDWDKQMMVQVEVEDQPMAEFINWILAGDHWMSDPDLLFRRVLQLRRAIAEGTILVKRPAVSDQPTTKVTRPSAKK